MKTLHIEVRDKIATYTQRDGAVVCGNSDYQIEFAFDSEWSAHPNKTARFIWNGQHFDQPFTGNTCRMPMIKGATSCLVGVYVEGLETTTSAQIPCLKSVLCEGSARHSESDEIYSDEALNAARRAEDAAERAEEVAKNFETGNYIESDPTVPAWAKQSNKPKYTAEEVGARPANWTPTEKDPTVPAWAKQPNKPTYTAKEVGALPANTKLADLEGDSEHRTVTDAEKERWNNAGGGGGGGTITESDPTVPAWAKEPEKPAYGWDEITDKPFTDGKLNAECLPDDIGGGGAPAGYGLGERVGRIAKNANDAVENGWWWGGGADAVNYPNGVFFHAPMFVSASEFMVVQTIYWMNYVLRRSGNRAGDHIDWFEWAYENPPLAEGVEYLTTERVNGVFIYKKADAEGNIYYRLSGETEWRNYTNVAGGGGGIMEESDPTVPAWAKQATKPKYTAEEVGARPADWTPTESDPTVPAWAKQPNKPTYTASEVGARPNTWTPTPADIGLKTELWTLTYEDGTTETKVVYVG